MGTAGPEIVIILTTSASVTRTATLVTRLCDLATCNSPKNFLNKT